MPSRLAFLPALSAAFLLAPLVLSGPTGIVSETSEPEVQAVNGSSVRYGSVRTAHG